MSGSGKSSIVFDTIAQEAGRQLNETFSKFIQGFMPKYRHPDVDAIKNLSLAIIVEQKRIGGNSRSTLGTITDIDALIRLLFSRIGQPHIGPSGYFSFNDPNGADVGPKAGTNGGRVMFEGSYNELLSSNTLTGEYMGRSLPIKSKPRISTDFYETKKSNLHNLKNVSLRVPKGIFTVVTGVAGSGKSTLVKGVFAEEYKDASIVDQSAVSANLRSNPATFTGIMDIIRKLFAEENKVSAGLFSYNSEGACEACKGRGFIETDPSFMDSVETICEECGGKRYKREVLDYKYNNKSIVQVLDMTIAEADEFFTQKDIINKLKQIVDVGSSLHDFGAAP